MKVSIIVPVYNVSDYIERCINSVIKQTYPDLECIIVNDCTPDDSIKKCNKLISAYNGNICFKILHHDKNRGLSASRNTGTEAATGDYIFYLDSDDEIIPTCIEKLINAAKSHPMVEIVQGQVESVPHKSQYEVSFLNDIDYIENNNWIRTHFFCLGEKLPLNAWNKLIKTDFIKNNSLFFKEGLIHEDVLWMFYVAKKLKYYSVIKYKTYIHFSTPNSIMSTTTFTRTADHVGIILNEITNNFDEPYFDNQLFVYLDMMISLYSHASIPKTYQNIARKFESFLLKRHYFCIFLLLKIYTSPLNKKQRGKTRLLRKIKETLQETPTE